MVCLTARKNILVGSSVLEINDLWVLRQSRLHAQLTIHWKGVQKL